MLINVNTIFCENLYQLNDTRHFAAGIFSGKIMLPHNTEIPAIAFALFTQFESTEAGSVKADIRLDNVDGSIILQHELEMTFAEPNDVLTIGLDKVLVKNLGSGTIRLHYRTQTINWTECGSLRLVVPFTPNSSPLRQ